MGCPICKTCFRPLGRDEDPLSVEIDGQCIQCLAEAGNPDAQRAVGAIRRFLIRSAYATLTEPKLDGWDPLRS